MAVTMELSVSMVFIVAALVVMMQMHFVNQKIWDSTAVELFNYQDF